MENLPNQTIRKMENNSTINIKVNKIIEKQKQSAKMKINLNPYPHVEFVP